MHYSNMDPQSLLFTIFYVFISACLVFPPNEFVSAGLTVQCLFSSWLGSESEQFIQYHIVRTVFTIMCHSLLPLGYLLGLVCLGYTDFLGIFFDGDFVWHIFLVACVAVPVYAGFTVSKWRKDRWKSHPIAVTLSSFANPNTTWLSVACDINLEFRRVDKICLQTNSIIKVIATDNWILKISPYTLECAHQSDTALILSSSDTHQVSPNSPGGAQFLNIEVKSTRPGVKPFSVRLNALDFKDLQDKISRPIAVLSSVTFHRTLTDRFLDAFREQVAQNPVFDSVQDLDMCMGCMQIVSNVKLQRVCGDTSLTENSCVSCYCRPMWCLDCMGKWFASRQDQARPETWLSSKCTCPVCRSRFCVRDVCAVNPA